MPNSRFITCNTQYFLEPKRPSRHARADGGLAPPLCSFKNFRPVSETRHSCSQVKAGIMDAALLDMLKREIHLIQDARQ